jgi:hypothetical protein
MDDKWEKSDADDSEFDVTVDLGDIGQQIKAEMDRHMARLSKELESKFGPDFSRELEEKLARKAEKAAQKAKRAESSGRMAGMNMSSASTPPPGQKQASAEEQMKILKMVESGSITPEEAAMLLEVLED